MWWWRPTTAFKRLHLRLAVAHFDPFSGLYSPLRGNRERIYSMCIYCLEWYPNTYRNKMDFFFLASVDETLSNWDAVRFLERLATDSSEDILCNAFAKCGLRIVESPARDTQRHYRGIITHHTRRRLDNSSYADVCHAFLRIYAVPSSSALLSWQIILLHCAVLHRPPYIFRHYRCQRRGNPIENKPRHCLPNHMARNSACLKATCIHEGWLLSSISSMCLEPKGTYALPNKKSLRST